MYQFLCQTLAALTRQAVSYTHLDVYKRQAYINGGLGSLDIVKIIAASDKIAASEYLPNTSHVSAGQGCIIENAEELAVKESEDNGLAAKLLGGAQEVRHIIMTEKDDEFHSLGNMICDTIKAAIKPATGWLDAPDGSREFVFFVSKGLERRYGLLIPNPSCLYDSVALYKTKKDAQPYLTLQKDELCLDALEMCIRDSSWVNPTIPPPSWKRKSQASAKKCF